jgi:GNAT superfamily N-acetyltransferase
MLEIRLLQPDDLPLLKNFAPPDWNTDLSVTFAFHFDQSYFHPIVAELEGIIVGCAHGILNGNSGWLGNIIVLPDYRGRGIGLSLTSHLVDFFHKKNCTSQILIATKMGKPVYSKLNFQTTSHYLFLKTEQNTMPVNLVNIRRLLPTDIPRVFQIDKAITGEDRRSFLGHFLDDGWVHESSSNIVDGFFLPSMAQGTVLAENDVAGLALLEFKIGHGSTSIVIPEANRTALMFLLERGFQETANAPRMVLGHDVNWHPQQIYSRGGGYCG